MEHAIFGRLNRIVVTNAECDGKLLFRNGSKNTIDMRPVCTPFPLCLLVINVLLPF